MTEEEQQDIKQKLELIRVKFDEIIEYIGIVTHAFQLEGWYFDYYMPIRSQYLDLALYDKQVFKLLMENYFDERINKIEELVIKRFPDREQIIRKAMNSHKIKDYELSIPVIIGQTDGIFRNITENELFSKRPNKKADNIIKVISNQDFKKFYIAFLEPLRNTNLISADFKESKKYPQIAHRNPILHGDDLNYASKTNSLKALSLLNYVSRIVYDIYTSDSSEVLMNLVDYEMLK